MSEGNLLRAKKQHAMAVTAKLREAKPSADSAPKIIPEARPFQSESGFPVAKPENHPYYHLANKVVEYVLEQRKKTPEEWTGFAATSRFRDTHRLINKADTQQRRAYDAAIRQLAANPRLAKKPQELEARLRLLLERRPSLKTLKKA